MISSYPSLDVCHFLALDERLRILSEGYDEEAGIYIYIHTHTTLFVNDASIDLEKKSKS